MKTVLARRDLFRAGLAASMLAVAPTIVLAKSKTSGDKAAANGGARIDYNDVQVLFADLQVSLVVGSKTVSPEALGRSAAALAKVATVLKLPMLFSVVPERKGEPVLIPELLPYATQANTLKRTLTGPFMDKATVSALASNGRKTLIVAGFAAEVVVLQTVLDAVGAGYKVQYVTDAIGGLSERTEATALHQAELAGGVPTSVVSLTTRMAPDIFHSPGSEAFSAIVPLL